MHDIGKNIVAVVLQCNNYEVVNLGVMVPAQTILDDRARGRTPMPSGCPGLITPSLEEMAPCRTRDGARRAEAAAADRRRDHLARAHRRQDRAQLLRRRWCTCPTRRAACRWCRACSPRRAASLRGRGARRLREDPRPAPRTRRGPGRCLPIAEARELGPQDRLDGRTFRPRPPGPASRCCATIRSRSSCPTSTGGRSSRPGSSPAPIRRSSRIRWSARRRGSSSAKRRRYLAARSWREKWITRPRRAGALSRRPRSSDDDIEIYRDESRA